MKQESWLEANVKYDHRMFSGDFYLAWEDRRQTEWDPRHGYLGSTDLPDYVFNLRVHTYDPNKRKSDFRYGSLSESVAFLEGTKRPLAEMLQTVKEHGDKFYVRDLLYLPVVDNLYWLHDVAPSQRLQATWELQRATVMVDRFMTATDWKAEESKRKQSWSDRLFPDEEERLAGYKAWWKEQGMSKYVGRVNLVKRQWANFWDYTVWRGS